MSNHAAIVQLLRDGLKENSELSSFFEDRTEEQIYRLIFHSFRIQGSGTLKGMRLTTIGYQMMATLFSAYEIMLEEGMRVGPNELLYLDARAKLPYYIGFKDGPNGENRLVVFETLLGTALKLADGNITTLVEMEGRN